MTESAIAVSASVETTAALAFQSAIIALPLAAVVTAIAVYLLHLVRSHQPRGASRSGGASTSGSPR